MLSRRYREITATGSPREIGRAIGDAAREEVRGFCDVALERVNKTVAISRDRAYQIAERSLKFAEDYSPSQVEELRGVAEAADVSLLDLMLLQVRNQLTPQADAGCTSLSIASGDNQPAIVAQNWDNDPLLDDFTVVLTRKPTGKPAFITVTQAGLIAYIGVSEAGIAACLNTLPAPSRDVGVPHYFTLHGIYEAMSLQEAVHSEERAHRAIPANIMLGTPDGPANLEITLDAVHVLRPETSNRITHTNHCLHPELCNINEQFPELIESHPRKKRIDELLAAQSNVVTVSNVQAILSDHQDHPRSICRHPNDDATTGFWQTVFSVVIEPTTARLHVARGTPCNHPFELYELQ